mmetsp:Transcript_30956/g.87706  ORF Transcript_30956/g.87706 Transcript_30956/m.87706 type:complete len:498 (-) Transcript_30956:356-1849(-)
MGRDSSEEPSIGKAVGIGQRGSAFVRPVALKQGRSPCLGQPSSPPDGDAEDGGDSLETPVRASLTDLGAMGHVNIAGSPIEDVDRAHAMEADEKLSHSDKPGAGRVYVSWNAEEEEALRMGVLRHGVGAWQVILRDPDFKILRQRTGIQLKDKWRNLVKFNHLSREEFVLAAKSVDRKWRRGGRGRDSEGGHETPIKPESPTDAPKPRHSKNGHSPWEHTDRMHHSALLGPGGMRGPHRHPREQPMPDMPPVEYMDHQDAANAHFHRQQSLNSLGSSLREDDTLTRWPSMNNYGHRDHVHHHHRPRRATEEEEEDRHPQRGSPSVLAEAVANPSALLPEGFDLSQKLGSDDTYQLVVDRLSRMQRITPNTLGSPLEQACMWQQWAQWSEVQMAGLIELRMLLAESLKIQSEADNSLLDMVVRCRTGTQSMDQLQKTLKICDLANEKVQTAYKLMDVWRRKICTEAGPDELHVALAGQAAAQGRLQQQIEHVVRSMRH